MNRKKNGPRIILAAFIVLICLPWPLWLLLGGALDTASHENRRPAPRPRLTLDSYVHFASDFTAYVNDAMPFRNSLIALNNGIDYFLYRTSSNENVIIGKDGWLFYGKTSDGDPLASYQGRDLLSEAELEQMAEHCLQQRDRLAARGKEFILLIVPNKERVYSEYMPEWLGAPAENCRALQVYRYLSQNTDLRVLYAYDELMRARESFPENLYYKTDTHWNALGGYVGSRMLLRELGIELPAIGSGQISLEKKPYSGDLAGLLNLRSQLESSDAEYTVSGYPTNHFEGPEGDILTTFDCRAETGDPRKLYVLRDSFAISMAPFLGSQFQESCFRHYEFDHREDFLARDPDVVVLEVVERKLDWLSVFSIL